MTLQRGSCRSGSIVAVVALALSISACATDPPDIDLARSVLAVDVEECARGIPGRATAVVVGPTTVVTVAHTFAATGAARLIDANGDEWIGELRHLDAGVDLAVIELRQRHPAPLGLGDVGAASTGLVLGYGERDPGEPPRELDYEVLRRVRVTLDGEGERGAMELHAAIRSGDSGAPVLDGRGRVAGIVFAAARNGDRGWAIDRAEIDAALERAAATSSGQLLSERGCGGST